MSNDSTMGKLFLLYVILVYRLNDAAEDVSSSKTIDESSKDAADAHTGTKNASYFINPKKFLTYVEQFDRIKSLGAEVRCKLHGSCFENKRHKIARKKAKAAKKSMQSRPGELLPDNRNNVLSPESLMSPVAAGLLPPGMGSEYTQQPGAASFGQQPQMNVKLPRGMEVQIGSQGAPTLDQMQNAENEASIQNSIKAKMDFMDRANGPQMALPGMHAAHDLAAGSSPDGLPGDLMTPGGSRAFSGQQHKSSREKTGFSVKRSTSSTSDKISEGNSSAQTNKTVTGSPTQSNETVRSLPTKSNETVRSLPTQSNETVKSLPTQSNETVKSLPTQSNETTNTTTSTTRTLNNGTLKNTTEISTNVSLSKDAKNDSTLITKNGTASLSNSSREDGPLSVNKTSSPKDANATKKSFSLRRSMDLSYRPGDTPPIYLTVKNGEKVLVVHPTAEFLQSLPRINFSDPAADKSPVGGRVRSSEIYTGKYAKIRDEIPSRDDDTDNDDDDDDDSDDDSEGSADSNINKRSNIAYVSVPVFTPDPNGKLNEWLRYARDKIARRDSTKNFDDIRNTQSQLGSMGNIYTAEEYLKGERKSNTELPVPTDIQNLYQKFHPQDSKANFQYIPSRDEVAEELQYAQQSASLNRGTDDGNVEQNAQNTQGELQSLGDYDMGPDTAAASPNSDPAWEEKYKNLDSDGRKRSPLAITK